MAQSLHRKANDFLAPESLTAEWMRARFPTRFSVERLEDSKDDQDEAT